MRTLRVGSTGDEVRLWEAFLRGRGLFFHEADGSFDDDTKGAVVSFQSSLGLTPDGVVGPMTWSEALRLGIHAMEDDDPAEEGPNWPPRPSFPSLDPSSRSRAFTPFSFVPAPTPGNPEGVSIQGGWQAANIVSVEIPQLAGVNGTSGRTRFQFHRLAAPQMSGVFRAWEKLGLLDLVLGWAGSFVPRFVRGSRTTLSNHSFGTAFDVNVPWNGLGVTPALVGRKGSVRRLVPSANALGLYWGGHFTRPDGMHFEVARMMGTDEVEAVLSSL